MTTTTAGKHDNGVMARLPRRAVYVALATALAKLAFMSAVAACLVILLVNAIVDALVYTIAGVLALFWSSCSVLTVAHHAGAEAPRAAESTGVVHVAAPGNLRVGTAAAHDADGVISRGGARRGDAGSR